MNYKIDPNATPLRNKNIPQLRQWPGQKYWILLITTIILLVSFTASFFVLLLTDTNDHGYPSSSNASSWAGANLNKDSTERPTGSSSSNKETIAPTTPSMKNYVASTSQFVQRIDGFIESNNTILIEIGNDACTSIAEKNADSRMYPASMTKVMSLLVACENLTDTSTKLTVSQKNVQFMSDNGGSGVGIVAGQILTVKDLLYLTSYQSDTVAILTLAEHIAGSEAEFVALMNNKAKELGLKDTNFANCTGLHNENNYTTCREMAAIMTYALDNPLCAELLTSYQAYPVTLKIWDDNVKQYVDRSCSFYSTWYSGRLSDNPRLDTVVVKGGKTGYTDESGVCLVSFAESPSTGKRYINVIVGQPKGSGLSESKSTAEVKKIYNTYAE